jgi:hypothetical protein
MLHCSYSERGLVKESSMKNLRYLVLLALCLGLTRFASADDFKMNVLDPLTGGVPEYTDSFNVTFTACSNFSNAPAGISGSDGCFEGLNATGYNIGDGDLDADDLKAGGGQTWSSLTLTFSNNSYMLAAEPAICGTLGGSGIFSDTSCTPSPGLNQDFVLSFTDGVIAPGASFFIVEDGVAPRHFTTGQAVAGVVPEPNTMLLSATGAGMLGLALYSQRRQMLRGAIRS